ncbi:MAG: cytochrome-c peroxidase [Deltaproteobacteria bacterium]|jgi:cytochrome c peroxidase|uniref:Di-c-type haem protein, MauG/cytochrome c peroxidase n=2 Tax=root TaxID=1 RepID=A0A2P0QJC9_9PROT|nr:Di-c-type haem protein, MauG/cytochrome c peroxidase [uncultured proteobacterium]MAF55548.1 cytochrome-c peroxidase [Deltaproteobacteria bacterium]MBJ78183.1 cytochrome-c peroxidase [Nitrospinota bacterium]MDP6309097.1 cytochrome c peroxidase [SAR324 cluster bacterium]MDP6487177.1 cytochrome c peroxidase [SAR324 cluster bacterium]|tara:strand:+ start:305 stop:1438 length:1134 start_codon:yes stop_codon:yes gene_type:complete
MKNSIKRYLAVVLVGMFLPALLLAEGDPDKDAPLDALGPVPVQLDNKQTPEKIELGKMLFFDPRLGGDASIACSDCHSPKEGWSFAAPISRGYPATVHWRSSQTIVNSAYYSKLFWAGASKSLEAQAPSAAKGGVAGNGEDDVMEARLAFIPEYRERFQDVFGDEWPLINNAWKAIAAFERTLVQRDTPFDKYMNDDGDALGEAEKRGLALFQGKANCVECHNGPLFSDQKYYNLGVPRHDGWLEDGMKQITFRFELYAKGVTEEDYRNLKDDPGLYFRTKQKRDKGKFRTPSLRYTLYTAPYMHNGAFFGLDEVIDFYNEGGGTNDFAANKTRILKPLGLTDDEKEDLLMFLESLSGEEILMEAPKLPKYEPLAMD